MILAKFYDRISGNHTEITKGKIPSVPREGETVVLDDIARTVHSVTWDFTKMEVAILLRS